MQSFGRSFTVIPSIDSTNNYAMDMVHARLTKHGDAWFALEQTKGKGQRGKTWWSMAGQNIALSIVIEPHFLLPRQAFLLNASVALGTYDFFKKYAGSQTRIKWPNDIFWGDRKAGGILIENIIRANKWLYAIAGIGLNINPAHFEGSLASAVSLKQITGKDFEVVELAKELCTFLEPRYEALRAGKESQIVHEYQLAMYKLNEKVGFKHNGTRFEAIVKGIARDGSLLVVNSDYKEQLLTWGTVEWQLH